MLKVIFLITKAVYSCPMKQISIKHLIFAHNAWLRGLDFYELELRFLQERLEEIAGDNTGYAVSEKIERFQNQFILHREYLDELKHRIHENMKMLQHNIAGSGSHVDIDAVAIYNRLVEDYLTEDQLFIALRHEFNRFAAEWM